MSASVVRPAIVEEYVVVSVLGFETAEIRVKVTELLSDSSGFNCQVISLDGRILNMPLTLPYAKVVYYERDYLQMMADWQKGLDEEYNRILAGAAAPVAPESGAWYRVEFDGWVYQTFAVSIDKARNNVLAACPGVVAVKANKLPKKAAMLRDISEHTKPMVHHVNVCDIKHVA